MAKIELKRLMCFGLAAGLSCGPAFAQAAENSAGYAFFLAASCNGPHGCHGGASTAPSGVDQDDQGYYKPSDQTPKAKNSSEKPVEKPVQVPEKESSKTNFSPNNM